MVNTKTAGDVDVINVKLLTGAQLTALYNELTGESVVRFNSRETALRRIYPHLAKMLETAAECRKEKAPKKGGPYVRRTIFKREPGAVQKMPRPGIRKNLLDLLYEGATFDRCVQSASREPRDVYDKIVHLNTRCGWGLREDASGTIFAYS